MARKKISYKITQTGPIELTENMGSDPAFRVPVEITCSNKTVNEELKRITGIYYHASQGWVPCNNDDELSFGSVITGYLDLQSAIQSSIDDFGSTILARVFRIAEAVFNQNHASVATALLDNDIDIKALKREGKV